MILEKHHELHRRKIQIMIKKSHLLLILEFFKDEVSKAFLLLRASVLEERKCVLRSLTRDLHSKIAPLISLYIENIKTSCLQCVEKQNWGQIFKNIKVFSSYEILCALQQRQRWQKSHCPPMGSTLQGYKHKIC